MSTNKLIVGILVLGVILGAGIYLGGKPHVPNEVATQHKTYVSDTLGIKFDYPSNYILDEKNTGSPERGRYTITLIENTPGNQDLISGKVQGEGPIAITIDIFQNDLDKYTAEKWIRGVSDSNYKLGNGEIASTTVGNMQGLEYTWSGLYEGRSRVVSTQNYIYMFSVTRMTPDDQILKDFDALLDSVLITE